jgi:hypothetical protein
LIGFKDSPRAELLEALPEAIKRMEHSSDIRKVVRENQLGEPMSIRQAARLIGCSAWTVRQKHVRNGLPCFRSGPSGRLTFYSNQVVAWILKRQQEQKGGQLL